MDNLDFKDPQSVMIMLMLLGFTSGGYYYHTRISELETKISELEKHLASIIKLIDPSTKNQIDKLMESINILHHNFDNLKLTVKQPDELELKPYIRLTKSKKYTSTPDLTDNLDEEIILMTGN